MTRFVGTPLRGIEFASNSDEAISTRIVGDAHAKIRIDAGGRITWSSGSAAGDTNIYRDSANVLKTDDVFIGAGGIVTIATDGAPTAALANGAVAVDITNNVFYFRSDDEWIQVANSSDATSITISPTAPGSPSNGELWFDSDDELLKIYSSGSWINLTGAKTLDELEDVDLTILPLDGDVLKYNASASVWTSGSVASGGATVTISDTPPESPEHGDLWFESDSLDLYIYYTDAFLQLTDSSSGVTDITDLADVLIDNPLIGEVLTYNGAEWINQAVSSASVALDALTDVVISGPETGQFLRYDGTQWINETGPSASVSLDGLTDVVLSSPTNGQALVFNGTQWVNSTVSVINDTDELSEGSTNLYFTEGRVISALPQDISASASPTFNTVNADLSGNASTASSLQTAQTIAISGDISGSALFDGSASISINATIQPDSVTLGTDTTGNYMVDVVGGTGVLVTHTPGESSSASIAIGQDVATTASVSFAHVHSDVTGDLTGNADTATALETARTISLSGDLSGSASFDGTANITISATVQPDSVALGTDTTGNFVADVVAGHAITVTHTPGEASSASVALNASITDLNDATIADPESFQTLVYDGAEWINEYPTTVSLASNAEATTITAGTAVYLFGGQGSHATVKRADNTTDTTSSKTVGLAARNIPAGETGPIVTRGYVRGVNLSVGYTNGDILWLGKNGAFTTTKPSAPDHLVFIGVVVSATNNGIIYVATQNGYEIDELHNVKINGSLADGDFLKYVSASAIWINDQINLGTDTVGDYVQNLVAGTGVTLSNNSGEGSTPTVAIGQDVSISASPVFSQLETTHNLIVGGSLFVSGSVVTENQVSLALDDPFIYLNSGSTETNPDLGIAGNYNDGSYKHAGLFRDATDGKFKFFDSYTPEPNNPIDVSHGSYSPAPVVAETFESTASTGTAPFTVSSTTEVANLHAETATSLYASRAISLAGDLSGSVSFDGSSDVAITATIQPNSVVLGTNTTGNYMADLAEGTGVTIIHTPGEASTASISLNASIDQLNDVSASSPSDGQFLRYVSASSGWSPANIPTINNLDDIGDVSVSGASNGQFLKYDGSSWVPDTIVGGASISSSAPSTPTSGQIWFDSDTAQTFVYYDSSWVEIGVSATGISVSESAPVSPINGQLWFNSASGGTFVYYQSASVWVEIGAAQVQNLLDLVENKGDILVGLSSGALVKVPVGDDSQILVANSSASVGVEWQTPNYASTGKAIAMAIVFGG